MPIVPALKRLKQKKCQNFEANLGYIVKLA